MDDMVLLIDCVFVVVYIIGFDVFECYICVFDWLQIEYVCGLICDDLYEVVWIYVWFECCIVVYGMGLIQYVYGSDSIVMLVNLLLMCGNMGWFGVGICLVCGYFNVQGQCIVGILEKFELVLLDWLVWIFDFVLFCDLGWNIVYVLQVLLDGCLCGFVSLGGNFVCVIFDQLCIDLLWQGLVLNVQIVMWLNWLYVLVGDGVWLLFCLVWVECDMQGGKLQVVSMEDSFSYIYGLQGWCVFVSDQLLLEFVIIVGIVQVMLFDNLKVDWLGWVQDYVCICDLIVKVYFDQFSDFNVWLFKVGGFYCGNLVCQCDWQMDSGKVGFVVFEILIVLQGVWQFMLIMLWLNDQFNMMIYGDDDWLCGLCGDWMILMILCYDMYLLGLVKGDRISFCVDYGDDILCWVDGLCIVFYDLFFGCFVVYYLEMNFLVVLGSYDL